MPTFNQDLLIWFDKYGRTDLPWQENATSYRVWISEVMLQQTQVCTVIPYFQKFMQDFPDVETLALATLDNVLHHWTGLGYYARARNLHRAANEISTKHAGKLPIDLKKLMDLPGIGRTTAGAILALADGLRYPILDGNVKRVLSRYYALEDDKELWCLAEKNTPLNRVAAYTQAIMDLGATVCTRRRPQCSLCPFNQTCVAHKRGQETAYPIPKPRKILPVKTTTFIMLQNSQGEILLEKRPSQGIWGGLWSFPECSNVSTWSQQHLNTIQKCYCWQVLRHTFTHFHLDIHPVLIHTEACQIVGLSHTIWYNTTQPMVLGLAAPVARLLAQLTHTGELLL